MALSTAHVPGDTGHISEHNTLNGFYNAHPVATTGVHGVTGNIVGDTDTQTLKNKTFTPTTSAAVGITVKGVNAQSADLQQWQNVGGGVIAKVDNVGNIYSDGFISASLTGSASSINMGSTSDTKSVQITTNAAANKGLVIRANSAQSANLQEWQGSSGTAGAVIDANQRINTIGGAHFGGTTHAGLAYLESFSQGASNPAIIARGYTGQTASIIESQAVDGTIIARVRAADRGMVTYAPQVSTAWTWTDGGGSTGFCVVQDGFIQSHSIKVCGTGSPYANTLTMSLPPTSAYGVGSGVIGAAGTSAAGHPLGTWAIWRSGSLIANGMMLSQASSTEAAGYSWGGGQYSFQPANGDRCIMNWNYFGGI